MRSFISLLTGRGLAELYRTVLILHCHLLICTKKVRLGAKVHPESTNWHAMIATELPRGLVVNRSPLFWQNCDAERQSLWRLGKR